MNWKLKAAAFTTPFPTVDFSANDLTMHEFIFFKVCTGAGTSMRALLSFAAINY